MKGAESISAIGSDESDTQGSDKETRDPQQENFRKGADRGDSVGKKVTNKHERKRQRAETGQQQDNAEYKETTRLGGIRRPWLRLTHARTAVLMAARIPSMRLLEWNDLAMRRHEMDA
jgi:hypothetical protein